MTIGEGTHWAAGVSALVEMGPRAAGAASGLLDLVEKYVGDVETEENVLDLCRPIASFGPAAQSAVPRLVALAGKARTGDARSALVRTALRVGAGNEAVLPLITGMLKSGDFFMRWGGACVVEFLPVKEGPDLDGVRRLLLEACVRPDEDDRMRREAADRLRELTVDGQLCRSAFMSLLRTIGSGVGGDDAGFDCREDGFEFLRMLASGVRGDLQPLKRDLLSALGDKDRIVRGRAAISLRLLRLRDGETVAALRRAASDEVDIKVRAEIDAALEESGDR